MSIDSRSPLAVTRRDQILDLLCQHGTVRVSELADQLDVTPMTVRRDIALLAEAGLLRRVHGGATLAADLPRVAAPDAPVERAPDAVHTAVRRIGMLVPSLDYYWPGVVRGAEEVARSCGLRVMLRGSSYDSDEDRTQIARLLEHGRVDGLIVAPNMTASHAQDTIDWLVGCGVPVVLVEREAVASFRHQPLESVVSDHVTGAAVAVRHLVNIGHRRVGLVTSAQSPHSADVRRGWLQANVEAGLSVADAVDESLARGPASKVDLAIDEVLDRCLMTGTTALLVRADVEAIGIAQHCERRGLDVPGDLSIVAYDDEVAGLFSPPLTAIHPPRTHIGATAVELLAARLVDPGRPVHRVVISPTLFVRDSTAEPRAVR